MGQSMIGIARRRARNLALTFAAIVLLLLIDAVYRVSLNDPQTLDGWMLAAAVIVLTIFNARKKLPMLPILSATAWLEFHAYLGITALALFIMHAGLLPPRGRLEQALWLAFLAVALSGIVGLWFSRSFPGRMRRHGEVILLDRIPIFRAQLAREVEELARQSVAGTGSAVISDLYAERLDAHFSRPRNFLAHLIEAKGPLHQLRQELDDRHRYLNPQGREILARIEEHVVVKDNLDYQYALLMTLRGWLFAHVPLTYALLLLVAGHMTLVYALGRI
jgi:hypothetical protein